MSEIILYLTPSDADTIVEWLNNEIDIAWIIKDSQAGNVVRWRAVHTIEKMTAREYCLWKIGAGNLRIPSGALDVEDSIVLDPFKGWEQTLARPSDDTPWFGQDAPETFTFRFKENGKEHENSIGRSGFYWIGNYFRAIGNGAPEECSKWWERLRRFVKKNAIGIPWPGEIGSGKTGSYAFPEAFTQLKNGRPRDLNP